MEKELNINFKNSQNMIELQSDMRKEINSLFYFYNKSSENELSKPNVNLKALYQKFKTYNTKYCLFNNIQIIQKKNNSSYLMCKNLCRILAINGFKDFRLKSIPNYFINLTHCKYSEFNQIIRRMYEIIDNYFFPNQIFNAPMTVRFISVCIAKVYLLDDQTTRQIGKQSLETHLARMESELEIDLKSVDKYEDIENTLMNYFKIKFKILASKKSILIYLSQAINKKLNNMKQETNDIFS